MVTRVINDIKFPAPVVVAVNPNEVLICPTFSFSKCLTVANTKTEFPMCRISYVIVAARDGGNSVHGVPFDKGLDVSVGTNVKGT